MQYGRNFTRWECDHLFHFTITLCDQKGNKRVVSYSDSQSYRSYAFSWRQFWWEIRNSDGISCIFGYQSG